MLGQLEETSNIDPYCIVPLFGNSNLQTEATREHRTIKMKLTGNPSDQPCNEICTKRTNLKSVQKPSYYGVSFASQKGFFGNTRREKYQLWSERDSMTPVVEFGDKVIRFRFLIVISHSGSILLIKTRTVDCGCPMKPLFIEI